MATAVERSDPRRYAAYGSLLALAGGAALLPLALGSGGPWLGTYLAGWGAMALIGVVGGTAQVARHGRSSTSFVLVMIACMLLRLISILAGVLILKRLDLSPIGFVVGLGIGFVPLQIFEGVWFYRTGQGEALRSLFRTSLGQAPEDTGRKPTAS